MRPCRTPNKVGIAENLVQCANTMHVEGSQKRLGTSSIILSIGCRNLKNKDNDPAKPLDPICVVFDQPESTVRRSSTHAHHEEEWIQLRKTERQKNNSHPNFRTKVQMEYRFEQSQPLRFQIYHAIADSDDDDAQVIPEEQMIGYAECTIGSILHAGPGGYTKKLQKVELPTENGHVEKSLEDNGDNGEIVLVAVVLEASEDEVLLELSGSWVGRWFSWCYVKSFFDLSKTSDVGTYLVTHKSDEVPGMNPYWGLSRVSGRNLYCGDWDRSIRIQVFRQDFRGQWHLVGFCLTNINRMIHKKGDRINLQSPDGKKLKTSITILNCSIQPKV